MGVMSALLSAGIWVFLVTQTKPGILSQPLGMFVFMLVGLPWLVAFSCGIIAIRLAMHSFPEPGRPPPPGEDISQARFGLLLGILGLLGIPSMCIWTAL
jgi:hypothetical protein